MQEHERPVAERDIPARFNSHAYLNVLDTSPAEQLCLIQSAAIQDMRTSAERHYPDEACGLLLGKLTDNGWHIDEGREVPNLNTARSADRFILDPEAYHMVDRELHGTGREIIGIYHSHPDCPAKPSPTDLANAWDGFAYIIVSTYQGHAADTQCWALNAKGNQFRAVTVQDLHPKTD
ncbi:MAG: M67 family metallopeptidase [Mariprofundaceae bacterium]|nr:M67 family metallopeptidase [Mariprofundaceae bacterium]